MNWRDLLYFSKGERRALTLLLCLITASWITLLVTDQKPMPVASVTDAYPSANRQAPEKQPVTTGKNPSESNPTSTRKETQSLPEENRTSISSIPPMTYKREKPSYPTYPRSEKFPTGTIVELNAADTATLKKVPGIGSAFARRIVKYRELLGGYYIVEQLREVYGIDDERYQTLAPWFSVATTGIRPLKVNSLPFDSLSRHPYLNYRQARAIEQLRKQKSRLSGWENLQLIEELTESDRKRLTPYLSFD